MGFVGAIVGGVIAGATGYLVGVQNTRGYKRCLRVVKETLDELRSRRPDTQIERLEKRVASLETLVVEEDKKKREEAWQSLEK